MNKGYEASLDAFEVIELEEVFDVFDYQCVYFVRLYIDGSPTRQFKIGYTKNIARRLRELRRGTPYSLEPFYTVYTSKAPKLESFFHTALKGYKTHHEWYEIPTKAIPSLKSWIEVSSKAFKNAYEKEYDVDRI